MTRASLCTALLLAACAPPPVAEPDAAMPDARVLCERDEQCDDGTFCNGVERCAPGDPGSDAVGCARGAAACMAEQECVEAEDRCITECDRTHDADGDGADAIECGGDDCDDADPLRAPSLPEICDAEDRDEDCDGSTIGALDRDGDGAIDARCCNGTRCGDDCDDADPAISPSAVEVCDLVDQDCDGDIDDGVQTDGFADEDRDLHGDPSRVVRGCPGLPGVSPVGDDCDDADITRHGGMPELCNERDDDCDGAVDDYASPTTLYRDRDGDGFGTAEETQSSCRLGAGWSLLATDCDDGDPSVRPGARERCNARDDDCNGLADFLVARGDGEDDDGDGFADAACVDIEDDELDCDDGDATINPAAPEVIDTFDNDCDGVPDDSCTTARYFVDADGDGFGDPEAPTVRACEAVEGHVTLSGDCTDADALVYPGARELCNATDDDCDGVIDEGGDALCAADRALGVCADGACQIALCESGRANCDGDREDGCESEVSMDVANCGSCGFACLGAPNASPTCGRGLCGYVCDVDWDDCDGLAVNGCEASVETDLRNCGACGRRCSVRPGMVSSCAMGACGYECVAMRGDCDADPANGCEQLLASSVVHCGACDRACAAGEICDEGACTSAPFASDGSEGPLVVAAGESVVLTPGVHHYTSIDIGVGAVVTTTGSGVLELYAQGDVSIAGTIDVRGARGGNGAGSTFARAGGGGATGNPLAPGADWVTGAPCGGPGGGGEGASGMQAPNGGAMCSLGGSFGGGAGGGSTAGGGGGGGFAGGGGGHAYQHNATQRGGDGASSAGGVGGAGGSCASSTTCTPARGGVGTGPYAGGDGRGGLGGGGGGGAIGADAEADLRVASTFRPGSGGGGGGGDYVSGSSGGGGGGGAIRIASATRIVITAEGAVLADGGAGGTVQRSGGGGSGGVIFLAAPALDVRGRLSAAGGVGGNRSSSEAGGDGGLGRIRLSVREDSCRIDPLLDPPLGAGCAPFEAAGFAYVARFPE